MPILTSNSTFVRFSITPPVVSDMGSYLAEVFKNAAFKEPEPLQKVATGFSSIEDMFDSDFPYASYDKGEYIAFNFRIDERKIPPSIFKQFLHESEKEFRRKHEGKRPYRDQWSELKTAVELKLLNKILPQPKAYQVVWNFSQKYLLAGMTQTKIIDTFLEYFEKHLKLHPKPLNIINLALEDAKLDDKQKDFLAGIIAQEHEKSTTRKISLGSEFLTWIWFYSDHTNGQMKTLKGKDFSFSIGGRIVLGQVIEERVQKVICMDTASVLTEARAALKEGKQIQEVQINVTAGENNYSFTLDTGLWAIKSLKTPPLAPSWENDDPDGRFYEKMYFLEEILEIIDALYHHFLTFRLGMTWERDVLPQIANWIGKPAQLDQN